MGAESIPLRGLSLSLSVLLLVQVHPECVARAVVLIYFSFFVSLSADDALF